MINPYACVRGDGASRTCGHVELRREQIGFTLLGGRRRLYDDDEDEWGEEDSDDDEEEDDYPPENDAEGDSDVQVPEEV